MLEISKIRNPVIYDSKCFLPFPHIFMKMHIVDRVNKFFYIMVFFNLQSSTLETSFLFSL